MKRFPLMSVFLSMVRETKHVFCVVFLAFTTLVLFPTVVSALFAPGETLDPGCAPTSASCTVYQVNASTTGNFGISTTSPWGLFSVSPSGISGPSFVIGSSTQTSFIITNGGNVGIGTTSPGSLFSVQGIANFTTATSTFISTGGGINLSSGCFAVNGTCVSGGSGSGTVGSGTQGQFPFYNGSGTTLTATSSLFISQAGNVGIGTTSPYAKLSVVGEAVFKNLTATSTSATSTIAGGLSVGGGSFQYDFSSGITSVDDLQVGPMTFDTNAGAVAWIDLPVTAAAASTTIESYSARIDGNSILTVYALADGAGAVPSWSRAVGIGTTSPWRTLSVSGSVAMNGLTVDPGTGSDAICLDDATKEVYVNSGNTSCSVSSARFKHDIETLSYSAIDIVRALRPVSYRLNSNDEPHLGFIAEEVATLEPRLIFTERGSTIPRGVRYEEFAAIFAKAIQEQQAEIDSLIASRGASVFNTIRIEDRLCVDDVCIEKDQLKAMIRSFGGQAVSPGTSNNTTVTVSTPDTVPPVIAIQGNNPATIDLNAPYSDLGVIVSDDRDAGLGATVSGDRFDTSVAGTYVVTYVASDRSGNTATSTRTVQVIDTSGL